MYLLRIWFRFGIINLCSRGTGAISKGETFGSTSQELLSEESLRGRCSDPLNVALFDFRVLHRQVSLLCAHLEELQTEQPTVKFLFELGP